MKIRMRSNSIIRRAVLLIMLVAISTFVATKSGQVSKAFDINVLAQTEFEHEGEPAESDNPKNPLVPKRKSTEINPDLAESCCECCKQGVLRCQTTPVSQCIGAGIFCQADRKCK